MIQHITTLSRKCVVVSGILLSRRKRFLSAAMLFLLSSTHLSAQEPVPDEFLIRGTATDLERNQPIADAVVTIVARGGPQVIGGNAKKHVLSVATDFEGNFSLPSQSPVYIIYRRQNRLH